MKPTCFSGQVMSFECRADNFSKINPNDNNTEVPSDKFSTFCFSFLPPLIHSDPEASVAVQVQCEHIQGDRERRQATFTQVNSCLKEIALPWSQLGELSTEQANPEHHNGLLL